MICIKSLLAQNGCATETIVYTNGSNFYALPNAFTPNNDGINDLLLVFNSAVNKRRIIISDTTGSNELFRTDDVNATWDGLDEMGQLVREGKYLLTLNYQFVNTSVEIGCRPIYLIRENCLDLNEDSLDFPIDFNNEALQFNANTVQLPACINPVATLNDVFVVSLYPNPASEKLYINTTLWIEAVKIYEPTGKLVFQQQNNLSKAIDISSLNTGLYVLQLNSQQHKIYRRFLVEQ